MTTATLAPVDVSGVRDPGMQAVIMLAASVGWNVAQKINQPVVITARDGHQKRLPTNTSIRMGVFQNAVSTVMTHTSEDVEITLDLIDAIVAKTKVSHDHERRLRLAIGETVAQHRERLATEPAQGPREPEPVLTQAIGDIVWEEPPEVQAPVLSEAVHDTADGNDHGKVVKRNPLTVRDGAGAGKAYISKSSYKREWEDGYVDYECMVCGVGLRSPRALGPHRMGHINRGEVEAAGSPKNHKRVHVEPQTPYPYQRKDKEPEPMVVLPPLPDIDSDPLFVLGQIAALVAPELIAEVTTLREQNGIMALELERLGTENTQLRKDWQALRDLIGQK